MVPGLNQHINYTFFFLEIDKYDDGTALLCDLYVFKLIISTVLVNFLFSSLRTPKRVHPSPIAQMVQSGFLVPTRDEFMLCTFKYHTT